MDRPLEDLPASDGEEIVSKPSGDILLGYLRKFGIEKCEIPRGITRRRTKATMIIDFDPTTPFDKHVEVAQKVTNTAVQCGYNYTVEQKVQHLQKKTTIIMAIDGFKYIIRSFGLRNTKDVTQFTNFAILVIMHNVYFKNKRGDTVPQGPSNDKPNTTNPEDIVQQTEESEVSQNTEITQAVDTASAPFLLTTDVLQHQSTSEPKISLNELTERHIVIRSGTLASSDTRNGIIFEIDLPGAIYSNLDTSTSTALRPFTLIKTDLEVTVKINSNQAQLGRYVLAAYPCRLQAPSSVDSAYAMVQRECVELDISTSADAILRIKYENFRNFLPIQTNELGEVTGESFTRLALRCISPIRVVAGAVDTVPYQVIARFVNPFLTGMRYPVPVATAQGPEGPIANTKTKANVIETVKDVNNVLKSIPIFGALYKTLVYASAGLVTSVTRFVAPENFTQNLENNLIYVGMRNKDKPVDIRPHTVLQPTPQKALCHGLGPIAATKMRLEMTPNTPHFNDLDTVQSTHSYSKLAQIGGIQTFFEVTTTQTTGTLLVDLPVAPYDSRYLPTTTVSNGIVLPPVSYISQLFQGYTGELELEFIPIKTAMHNFSILVAFIPFDGAPGGTTFQQALSCRYKIIDFRTNSSGVFTIPFVDTSMFRTYPGTDFSFMFGRNLNTAIYTNAQLGVASDAAPFAYWTDPGKVSVFLLNPLNPTPIVVPQIEVMVKLRGANNIQFTIPSEPRFRLAHNIDSYALAPIINNITNANLFGTVPQGPVQTLNDDEVPGDIVQPLIGPHMTHLEHHDDILNVCRRMMHYATVRTGTFVYVDGGGVTQYARTQGLFAYIPIVINDPVFQNSAQNNQQSQNAIEMMPRSIRDATSAMFRFGRGGVILSILNHSDENLIYTFLPPYQRPVYSSSTNGEVLNVTPSLGSNRESIGLIAPDSYGYASVRNVPSVNRVTDIEIPYYSSQLYMDLQTRYTTFSSAVAASQPWSMRRAPFMDAITKTLGTLKIQHELYPFGTTDQVEALSARVTIRLGLSDDFMYSHFLGVPPIVANYPLTAQSNVTTRNRKMSRDEIETMLQMGNIESNPGPIVLDHQKRKNDLENYTTPQGLLNFLSDLVSAPSEMKKLREQGDYFQNVISTLQEKITSIFKVDMMQAATLASAIVSAYMNPSVYTVITAVVSMLASLRIVDDKFLMKLVIGCNDNAQTNGQGPLDDDKTTPTWLVPTLAAAFIEYCATPLKKAGYNCDEDLIHKQTVLDKITEALAGINWFRVSAVMMVTSRLIVAMTWLMSRVKHWIMPSAKFLLITQNPRFIKSFMDDYEFIMNEMNKNHLMGLRQCRDRFWVTLLSAYYIKNIMASEKVRNPGLLSAVNDVIKRANELTSIMAAPPVRFEPFVVWMFGERGVGKSTILGTHIVDLLEKHQGPGTFNHPNPLYTRDPTKPWWNGYINQLAVLYDDLGTVSAPDVDPMVAGELMAIKSCAIMPIEKPRLEDKETLMTSIVVGCASNHPYLQSSVIRDTAAMDRRRDILVKVDFTLEVKEHIKKNKLLHLASALPESMTKDDKHLRFGIFNDPTRLRTQSQDVRSLSHEPDMWLTKQEYDKYSIDKFTEYYNRELERMSKRYKDMLRLCPAYAEGLTDNVSVKTAVMQMILRVEESRSSTTMDTLRYLVQKLDQTTPEYYKTLHKTTRDQLDILKEINAPIEVAETQAQGQFIFDRKRIKPGHWMEKYVEKNIITDTLKWIYDTVVPWHAPLYGKVNVEIEDDVKCVFCKQDVDCVTYVCQNVTSLKHVACTCRAAAIMNEQSVVCSICDLKMEPVIKREPSVIFRWMAHLRREISDILENPMNKLGEVWDNEVFRTNLRNIIISATFALVMYSTINYSDVILKNVLHNKFLRYVGELPAKVYTAAERIYIRTKSGLLFAATTKELDNIEFVQTNCTAQGMFDSLEVEPGSTVEVDISGAFESVKKKKTGKKRTPVEKVEIINEEKFCELSSDSSENDSVGQRMNFYDWISKQDSDKCIHTLQDVRNLLSLESDKIECALDQDLIIFGECIVDGKETTVEIPIVKCNNECIMLSEDVVMKLSSFFEKYSVMWRNHIDEGLIKYVPLLYLKFLEETENKVEKIDNCKYMEWQKDLLHKVVSVFQRSVSSIWEFMTTHYKTFLSICTVVFCIYKGHKWYTNSDNILEPIDTTPQSSYMAISQRSIKHGITRQLNSQHMKGTLPHGPHLKEPTQAVVSRAMKIRKNYVTLKLASHSFWALGLYGHTIMMTRHNWSYICASAKELKLTTMTLNSQGREDVVVKIADISMLLDLPQIEHVLLELPKRGLQNFSNIRHFFMKGLDSDGESSNPVLDELAYYLDVREMLQLKATAIQAVDKGQVIETIFKINGNEIEYRNEEAVPYDWIVTSVQAMGMCMSVFLNKQGDIIGFHVAGNKRLQQGYVIPVYREQIPLLELDTQAEGPQPNLTYLETVMNAPYHTFTSKIIPSPLQSYLYDPEKEPCIQSKFDKRYQYTMDPLTDGVETIGQYTEPLDKQILDLAYVAVKEELLAALPAPYTTPPVSEYEAITANKAPNASPMNLSTSVGYPLASRGSAAKQKRDFVTGNGMLVASAHKSVNDAYVQRANGVRPPCIYWAHLKDELRTKEKLMRKGGTRVFSVPPLELVVNSRRILLPFMDAFQTFPIETHHAIGLNPNSNDWTRLKNRLLEKGPCLLQMDYKNYSDAIPKEAVAVAFKIIIDYYSKWNCMTPQIEAALETLYFDIAESKLLIYDHVYQVNNGVLAGHPLTSIINSIVNVLLMTYMWVKLTRRRASEFFELTYIIVMGDDVVISLPVGLIPEFNCQLICDEFKKYNIVVTDSEKNLEGRIKRFDTFDKFEFLSRGMRVCDAIPQITLAPVKTLALFDCPLWINKGTDVVEQVIQSIQAGLILAFDHGPNFFDRYKRLLVEGTGAPVYNYFTWQELFSLFHSNVYSKKDLDMVEVDTRCDGVLKKKPMVLSNIDLYMVSSGGITSMHEECSVDVELGEQKKKPLATPSTALAGGYLTAGEGIRRVLSMYDVYKTWTCDCKYNCMELLEKKEKEKKEKLKKLNKEEQMLKIEHKGKLVYPSGDGMFHLKTTLQG